MTVPETLPVTTVLYKRHLVFSTFRIQYNKHFISIGNNVDIRCRQERFIAFI
jgi:hypothetical protein